MTKLKSIQARVAGLDIGLPEEVPGRVLLTDADSTAYVAAATTKHIETAKTRFVSGILTAQFLAGAKSTRIYLTAAACKKAGRFKLRGEKLYQANRDAKLKPGLVEPLRQAIGRGMFNIPEGEDWYVNLAYELEADDQIIIDAWATGIDDAVVYSADKDLRCWPGRFLDPYTNRVREPVKGVGFLEWHQNPSDKVLIGHGPIFFWAQMLMGDMADNIAGLRKVGKTQAYELLARFNNTDDESAIAELVLREYMRKGQNPWPEAYGLWLYRTPTYSFAAHINTLTLSDELRVWLHEMFRRDWHVAEDWRESAARAADEGDGDTLPDLQTDDE